MHSIRTRFTMLTVGAIIIALSIATMIAVVSIKNLGRSDADQLLHLTAATGAMNLESYFTSVEHSVETVSTLVQDSFGEMPLDLLDSQVERARHLFGKVASNTNGVLTYYFRIDPAFSETVTGFWYVNLDGTGFREHEVTDITRYDTDDTSALVWFTVPKATGKGTWLPPYVTDNLDVRVISYNVPVYWNSLFVGVVGIEIDYETLAREAESIRLFENGYAFILDAEYNVIYHPQMDTTRLFGEKVAVREANHHIGSNHIQYLYEGVEKEAVWLPLSNGMTLYVSVPLSEINSWWRSLVWNILLASIIVLAIVSLLMMRFAGSLTKPLRDLTEAAMQADRGNYEFALDYNEDDEVGILTRTFKQLAAHTKDHISDLNKQVYVDALTSVRNKGAYAASIEQLQIRMDDPAQTLAFAIGVFDCDNLKAINDTYGHDKGDVYLKTASRLICRVFQHSPVFRIGGDEFAVILENEDFLNREALLSRFRGTRAEICRAAEHPWDEVNVTLGLAVYDPGLDTSVIDVARRADQRMYLNKRLRKEERQKSS